MSDRLMILLNMLYNFLWLEILQENKYINHILSESNHEFKDMLTHC